MPAPDPRGAVPDPTRVSLSFAVEGTLRQIAPLGRGHINDTFLATYEHHGRTIRVVHQRINDTVLTDPPAVMANIGRVLDHLRARLREEHVTDVSRRVLTLVPVRADGSSHLRDEDGRWWRTYLFIEGAHSGAAASPRDVFEAAKAFATFVRHLADLGGPPLSVAIPDFHDTGKHFERLRRAIAEDPFGRAAGAREEIAFALGREPLTTALRPLAEQGLVAERVVHNDTKADNVLIDDATGEGLCVVDLDTVMPGFLLYDLGDLVRSASSVAAEDERDLSRVAVEPRLFEAIVSGTLAGAAGTVSDEELDAIPLAGRVITYECGLRFLTDHLLGDGYFRLHRPGQNLDRARVQQALLRSLETRDDELRRIVDSARTSS